jgi:predicted DNA-binding protein (MmcQ/YjbR family)
MAKKKATAASVESELREFALAYPETHEDFPWGERAIKVKGKVFIFMRTTENEISFSVKLPQSRDIALDLPWAEPTHYGMGKHGWVTAKVDPKDAPVDMIKAWIDESFRAVAPKTLVKKMDASR